MCMTIYNNPCPASAFSLEYENEILTLALHHKLQEV